VNRTGGMRMVRTQLLLLDTFVVGFPNRVVDIAWCLQMLCRRVIERLAVVVADCPKAATVVVTCASEATCVFAMLVAVCRADGCGWLAGVAVLQAAWGKADTCLPTGMDFDSGAGAAGLADTGLIDATSAEVLAAAGVIDATGAEVLAVARVLSIGNVEAEADLTTDSAGVVQRWTCDGEAGDPGTDLGATNMLATGCSAEELRAELSSRIASCTTFATS